MTHGFSPVYYICGCSHLCDCMHVQYGTLDLPIKGAVLAQSVSQSLALELTTLQGS